jgi:hypothetical protein
MRPLAIARFRVWTTLRAATPLLFFALIAPLVAMIISTAVENMDVVDPVMVMKVAAVAAFLPWLFSGFVLVGIAHELGNPLSHEATLRPSDLIDSAPVAPEQRMIGEFLGIFTATIVLHVACLPVLAVNAALSPLPTSFFAWVEACVLAAIILASASAAWRRVVLGPTRAKGIQATRNTFLFFLLTLLTFIFTTNPVAFRDAAAQFTIGPSLRAWARLVAAIEYPVALLAILGTIYAAYLAYFFLSSLGQTPQE